MKIGLITDIHEDIVHLECALRALEQHGAEQVVCMGDLVGFIGGHFAHGQTRDARECVRLVRASCSHVVCGNHDLFAIRKLPVFRGGFRFPRDWYHLGLEERKAISGSRIWLYETDVETNLRRADRDYLAHLPEYATIRPHGTGLVFSHFLFPDLTGCDAHSPQQAEGGEGHFAFMERMECEWGFFGHTHVGGLLVRREAPVRMFPLRPSCQEVFPWGVYRLEDRPLCLGFPPVADAGKGSGAAVLDTANMELTVFPLKETRNRPAIP